MISFKFFVFINPFKNLSWIDKNEKSEQQESMKLLKNNLKRLNTIFFVFIDVSKKFCKYIRTETPGYKIAWNYSQID